MTSWAHTSYLVRYLKRFGYIKQRKIRNGKVHRHKKSLFISKSYSVTISGVLDYILKNTQYKLFPQKKKKKRRGTKEKDRVRRRQERGKWKRGEEEKGWKEFKKKKKKRSVIGRKKEKKIGTEEKGRKKKKRSK